MSFLDDIKKQPSHIREIMFTLCVIITLSLVGLVWFKSFQKNVFVLMNPDQQTQQQFFATTQNIKSDSLFGNIGDSFIQLKASIASLFRSSRDSGGQNQGSNSGGLNNQSRPSTNPHPLPISGSK